MLLSRNAVEMALRGHITAHQPQQATITRAIRALEAASWPKPVFRKRWEGGQASDQYNLTFPAKAGMGADP
jgi:hypothetical protein